MGLSISKTQLNHRFEMVATQKKKVNKSKEGAIDEFNREKPIVEYVDINEDNAQDNTMPATKCTTTVNFIKCIRQGGYFMNFIEFQRNKFTKLVSFILFFWRGERLDIRLSSSRRRSGRGFHFEHFQTFFSTFAYQHLNI